MAESIAARARAAGIDPLDLIYDELLKDEGRAILYRPSANRNGERFENAGVAFLKHPHVLLGLGDGGEKLVPGRGTFEPDFGYDIEAGMLLRRLFTMRAKLSGIQLQKVAPIFANRRQ